MRRCRSIHIVENYFERHLNHVYAAEECAFITIRGNVFYGASRLPGLYPGLGGPPRRACDIYLEGERNREFTLAHNMFETPVRPAETAPADWGTERWGDSYEQLHLTGSDHRLLENPRSGTTFCGGGRVPPDQRLLRGFRKGSERARRVSHAAARLGGARLSRASPAKSSRGAAAKCTPCGRAPSPASRSSSARRCATARFAWWSIWTAPDAAQVEVPAGESFGAATFDKDSVPVDQGMAVEVRASSSADQDPSPVALDAAWSWNHWPPGASGTRDGVRRGREALGWRPACDHQDVVRRRRSITKISDTTLSVNACRKFSRIVAHSTSMWVALSQSGMNTSPNTGRETCGPASRAMASRTRSATAAGARTRPRSPPSRPR